MARQVSRRRLLQTVAGGALVALGGCTALDTNDSAANDDPKNETTASATPTATPVPTTVEIQATYPADVEGGVEQRTETVLTESDFESVGDPQEGGGTTQPHVPVTLTESAAEEFTTAMVEYGFTDEGTAACDYQDEPAEPGYCLQTVVDGEITYSASMSPGLAENIESGAFEKERSFVLQTENFSRARELQTALDDS